MSARYNICGVEFDLCNRYKYLNVSSTVTLHIVCLSALVFARYFKVLVNLRTVRDQVYTIQLMKCAVDSRYIVPLMQTGFATGKSVLFVFSERSSDRSKLNALCFSPASLPRLALLSSALQAVKRHLPVGSSLSLSHGKSLKSERRDQLEEGKQTYCSSPSL